MMDKWVKHWLETAKLAAQNLSKDPSTKVGAVAVRDRRLLSTGINGFPRGFADTLERLNDRATKIKYVVHAEENAVFNAGREGVRLEGATLYTYGGLPICCDCAKAIVQAGISRVVMCYDVPIRETWRESCTDATSLMSECGVEIQRLDRASLGLADPTCGPGAPGA